MSPRVPLSVLDLAPFGSGRTARDGLLETIDLARHAESWGFARHWLAEHHGNPGISGSAPHVLLAAIAAQTESIRLGTAATIIGNSTPLQVAESIGTVAALHPGRVDLGIGRSGTPRRKPGDTGPEIVGPDPGAAAGPRENRVVDGLVIPPPHRFVAGERFRLQAGLLGRTPGDADSFEQDVADIRAFLAGAYVSPEGLPFEAAPAAGSDVEVWIHGSSAGPSARLAGQLGLPFGSNYHVLPSFVLDAVAEYRTAFVPNAERDRPHVIVSADVVVADSDAQARELAAGYGAWVLSIRESRGAIPFPTPSDAAANPLTPAQLAVVQDRLDTQFVGSPATVVERLETLRRATGADELLITTAVHDHADRLRSYELLADAWAGVGAGRSSATADHGAGVAA
ncbi:LLM class flavin-dependent oxidoreductase [Schumannella soli]|uniref:LLM class flavin-dependent oxidoreductase n=1 Tax=Schumannella soli TaxID=2590779 RepID=A0A506Y186_9MICO|nr:LLM class flavin-dependent oxidoreductase [Schumannella soli]TPW75712.1 LLM class flavin-dependent oxidoreductase [Schumannella soli]